MGDVIVYVSGGAMSAVFGVGVLSQLQTLGLRERVTAIYGVSAGALNGAFFATGAAEDALSWYTHLVTEENIIKHRSAIDAMRGIEALDMAHAEAMLTKRQLLDVDKLMNSPVPVFAKVLQAVTREISYIDVRRPDAAHVLRASATLVPFADHPVHIDGQPYIDGAIAESIGIERLRALHPGARFIIIVNNQFAEYSVNRFLQWAVMRAHDANLASTFWENSGNAGLELEKIRASPDCFVFAPPEGYPVNDLTTEVPLLERGFTMGRAAVDIALPKLRAFIAEPVAKEENEPEQTSQPLA